jgi:hypothetical protein
MQILNEILSEIFMFNIDEPKFLFTCLLVNKTWCQNVVPILWVSPFHSLLNSIKNYEFCSKVLITTYISCLHLNIESSSNNLKNSDSHTPMFNYPTFIRHLSLLPLLISTHKWCEKFHNQNYDIEHFFKKTVNELILQFAKCSHLTSLDMRIHDFDETPTLIKTNFFMNNNDKCLLAENAVSNWLLSIKELEINNYLIINNKFYNLFNVCKNIRKVSVI